MGKIHDYYVKRDWKNLDIELNKYLDEKFKNLGRKPTAEERKDGIIDFQMENDIIV